MSRIEFETDLDKCVSACAESRANCCYRLLKGTCTGDMCPSCETNRRIYTVYSGFADVDKLRVDTLADRYFMQMQMAAPVKRATVWEGFRCLMKVLGTAVFVLLMCLLIFGKALAPRPRQQVYSDRTTEELLSSAFENNILYMSWLTGERVYDTDGDGRIDCVDWAVVYWRLWRGEENRFRSDIEIVRNWNRLRLWHHLFVRVRDPLTDEWVYVEPQACLYGGGVYKMADVWGDAYNPLCNIYGETYKWASVSIK